MRKRATLAGVLGTGRIINTLLDLVPGVQVIRVQSDGLRKVNESIDGPPIGTRQRTGRNLSTRQRIPHPSEAHAVKILHIRRGEFRNAKGLEVEGSESRMFASIDVISARNGRPGHRSRGHAVARQ